MTRSGSNFDDLRLADIVVFIQYFIIGSPRLQPAPDRRDGGFHTNDHFLTETTKDEKWLVLVGRPSLAAFRWRARRPAPPGYFHIKVQSNDNFFVGADLRVRPERAHAGAPLHTGAF